MFSADNMGLIIVWKSSVKKSRRQQPCHRWCVEKVHAGVRYEKCAHISVIDI